VALAALIDALKDPFSTRRPSLRRTVLAAAVFVAGAAGIGFQHRVGDTNATAITTVGFLAAAGPLVSVLAYPVPKLRAH